MPTDREIAEKVLEAEAEERGAVLIDVPNQYDKRLTEFLLAYGRACSRAGRMAEAEHQREAIKDALAQWGEHQAIGCVIARFDARIAELKEQDDAE